MDKKLIKCLNEFSNNLQELSIKPIENMEIILPYEHFKQLRFELDNMMWPNYGKIEDFNKVKVQTISGINFTISCKELNDELIKQKLNECFKILSK